MPSFKKKILISSGILALIVVFFVAAFWFLGSNIQKKVERLNAVEKSLEEINTNFSSLALLKQQYNAQVADYLKIIENIIPPQDNLINFLKDFQSLATASNLGFGFSFAGQTPPTEDSLGYISFSSSLQGGISQFLSFIESLPKISFLVNLNSANLRRQGDLYQIDLKGRVFFK